MKVSSVCLFSILWSGFATAEYSSLVDILLATPECARNCSLPSVSGMTCRPTTVQELASCLCPDMVVRRKMAACAQNNCIYKDVLLAGRPAKSYCANYPVPSRGDELKRVAIALLVVTTPFIILRIWSRGFIMKVMWWDDYTLATAFVVHIAWIAMNIPMVDHGYGKHIWDVDPRNSIPLSQMFFAAQLFYVYVQFVTKLSILICYLRIFPQRKFRIVALGTFGFITLKGLGYMFVVVFRCWPIASNWDRNVEGKCLNGTTYVYVAAALSIVEDLWILALPIPVLKSLKIPKGKKIALGAMFGVGILACITSIIRTSHISAFGDPVDPSWDNIDTSIWSLIENSVAVICAALPALRPLLSRYVPILFGTISANRRSKAEYGYKIHESSSKRSGRRMESGDEVELHNASNLRQGRTQEGSVGHEEFNYPRGRARDLDGDQTSGSSFNFAFDESPTGIRRETTFQIYVTRPEKSHTRNDSMTNFS